jgi:TetR/AcrR family transcriptional regulator of autoinduction and epiphytic fitness
VRNWNDDAEKWTGNIRLKTMAIRRAKESVGLKEDRTRDRLRLEESRVEEILDIAAEHFISQGFEAASIGAVAREANASKTTLYSRFPTKEDLFMAVLERRMNAIFSQVSTTLPVDGPIEKTLKDFGLSLLQFAISKDQVALLRVVSMESTRFPKLAERFYELGPMRGLAHLAQYLREQIKRKRLINENPDTMAEHLSSLLTGGPVRWSILGLRRNNLGEETQKERVDTAVKVFLRAYSDRKYK